jgi:ketosteroid isomerase-like protein
MRGASTNAPLRKNRRMILAAMLVPVLMQALWVAPLYAGLPGTQKHERRHEIDQLEDTWRNAVLSGNTAAMDSLLADDYMAITASGTLQTKEQALVQGTNAEGDFTGSFRYTRVYVRDVRGEWKIVSFEASRIRGSGERRQ